MKELRKVRVIVEFRPHKDSYHKAEVFSATIEFLYEHNPYDLTNDLKKQAHAFWNGLAESQKWGLIDSTLVPKDGILKLLAVK